MLFEILDPGDSARSGFFLRPVDYLREARVVQELVKGSAGVKAFGVLPPDSSSES